jgi:hypothetical protein
MDNVQDIRQFLFESVDTCYITNYNLYLNGNKLNDFSELSEITDLKADSVIEMQEGIFISIIFDLLFFFMVQTTNDPT